MTKHTTILHVDDDPQFGELTKTFLEDENDRFAIETVTSADAGLNRIGDGRPDCVVSDYNMPGMDGLEFLQAVRETYPDLPFILYTGKGSEAVASDAIAADVTDYLQKGSGSEQYELLANRIRNAVQARREAERADRQEQLMRLTEFAGDTGGFELHAETGEMLLTDGIRRLIDLPSQADLTLDEAIDLYHPEDREDIRQTIDHARQTGERTHGTWRLQAQGGNERIVDVTVTPAITGGDTEILRGSVHDITEQHERQQELKTERRFIEQALDALEDLFYVIDTDGTLRRWNEKGPELTGRSESELDGMPAIEFFPEDEREIVSKSIEKTLTDGEATVNANLLTADGKCIPFELRGARLTDEDGNITGLVGIGRDLTERRQRDRRFRALVEESNDVISIVDADGRYQYQSPSLERILGHDPEGTVGDTAWEYIHPDDRERVLEAFETWVANPDQGEKVIEYRARHADGSWRWMEAEGNNQLDNPAVGGYVVNSRDVTDRKEREQQLNRERKRYTTLFETLPNPVLRARVEDGEPVVEMVNPAFEDTFGYDAETIRDEPLHDYILPDDRTDAADRLNRQVLTEGAVQTEIQRETTEGIRTFQVNVTTRNTQTEEHEGYVVYTDLTERKQTERALKQERDLVTGIVETVPVGISVHDADGSISFGNEQMESISGRSLEDLEGNPHDDSQYDLVDEHAEPLRSGKTPFDRVVSRETAIHSQVVGSRRPSGERVWLSVSGAPQYNENGELERAVFAFEDITEQRELKAELSEIFGRISDAFFALDEEFRFTHVNNRAEKLLGAPESELVGETPWEIYPEVEENDETWDGLRAAIDTQESRSLEFYSPEDNWYEVTMYPSESGVSVYFQDVTERKNREQELQELKSQYETLAENFPDGAVFLIDTDLECVRAAGEELSRVGLSPEDVESKKPHDLYPEEIADELCHYYEEALAGSTNTFEQEYGGERYRIQTVPVRTDDEKIDHVMAVSQNITERAEDKQNLEAQNERLEEFASIVSHDLRGPLSVADAYLELAQETYESDYFIRAADAINRSQALIDDLLKLAREGETVGELEPVDLADVAEHSWQTVETGSATLETHATRTLRADRSRFQELVGNFYRNAIEHGGDDVTVSVGTMDDGFYVADTGPGIPESDREVVFEARYSTTEDGTGFGLRIVEQIADAHGWEVTVTESEEGGARFEFTGVERVE